jgi:hypothetical protein
MGTIATLYFLAPQMRSLKEISVQVLIAAGLCVLLADFFFLQTNTIPFTESRVPVSTDLAFVLLRYVIAFPTLVFMTANIEPWIEASATHLLITTSLIVAAHIALRHAHAQIIAKQQANQNDFTDEPGLFQTLGLKH